MAAVIQFVPRKPTNPPLPSTVERAAKAEDLTTDLVILLRRHLLAERIDVGQLKALPIVERMLGEMMHEYFGTPGEVTTIINTVRGIEKEIEALECFPDRVI